MPAPASSSTLRHSRRGRADHRRPARGRRLETRGARRHRRYRRADGGPCTDRLRRQPPYQRSRYFDRPSLDFCRADTWRDSRPSCRRTTRRGIDVGAGRRRGSRPSAHRPVRARPRAAARDSARNFLPASTRKCSSTSAASTDSAIARFFGLWCRSQPRSLTNSRTTARNSSS